MAWRGVRPCEGAVADELGDGVEGQVRVDGCRSVAEEERHVVHLPGLTRLDDETHAGAGLFLDEMVMDSADEQEGGDRRQIRRGVPVGQHDDLGAFGDGVVDLLADVGEGLGQGPARLGCPHREETVDGEGAPARAGCRPR